MATATKSLGFETADEVINYYLEESSDISIEDLKSQVLKYLADNPSLYKKEAAYLLDYSISTKVRAAINRMTNSVVTNYCPKGVSGESMDKGKAGLAAFGFDEWHRFLINTGSGKYVRGCDATALEWRGQMDIHAAQEKGHKNKKIFCKYVATLIEERDKTGTKSASEVMTIQEWVDLKKKAGL